MDDHQEADAAAAKVVRLAALEAAKFKGRIVNSRYDTDIPKPSHVSDFPMIMIPEDADDVVAAIKLKNLAHSAKMIISSGSHTTTNDSVSGTEAGSEGTVVIDLQLLRGITITDEENACLTVGVATPTAELAKKLVAKGWFLPLNLNLSKSVVSSVTSGQSGLVTRCAGLLQDHVQKILYVDRLGNQQSAEGGDIKTLLEKLASGSTVETIVCSIEFQCQKRNDQIWLTRYYIPYVEKKFTDEFCNLVQNGILGGQWTIPNAVDLNFLVRTDGRGIPLVVVTVAGNDRSPENNILLQQVETSLADLFGSDYKKDVIRSVKSRGASKVVDAMVEIGFGGAHEYSHLDCTVYSGTVVEGDGEDNQLTPSKYCHLLEFGSGHDDHGKLFPDLRMFSALRLTTGKIVEADVYLYLPHEISKQERKLQTLVRDAMPPALSPYQGRMADDASRDSTVAMTNLHRYLGERHTLEQTSVAALIRPNERPKPPTPLGNAGFSGTIVTKGDRNYVNAILQYATTSYPTEDMSPTLVAYPNNAKDIGIAISYAKLMGKKIVTRSGGHQYCGLSSGGDDTILLSMEKFASAPVVTDNIAVLGPGCHLTNIASAFKHAGVTIPHGECPLVAIGGHFQTGGFGHLLRSFGLALDHVLSFDMVLSDGTLKTFHRPEPGQAPDDLYWAVLGGGPGSFGVVTEIKLECIRDSDHPKSFGYERALFFEDNVFKDAMMQVKYWTENVNNPNFPKDVDLMVTATSEAFNPARPMGVILLELVYGNYDGINATQSQINAALKVIDDTINAVTKRRWALAPSIIFFDTRRASPRDKRRALSYMSKAFVREPGIKTTYGDHPGREFQFPYNKRLQCTTKPITQKFVDEFSKLVSDVIHDDDKEYVKLVFQMTLGGGQVKNPGDNGSRRANTSISGRDNVIGIVFDIFYDTSRAGMLHKANGFQERMQILVDNEFGEDIRMQWGSFGNVDMKEVWQHYYDSKELYEKLQDIKKATDPNDMFHTKFTVQLPDDVPEDTSEVFDTPAAKKRKTS